MKRRTTNLSKLPQTTSEAGYQAFEGDKQLVIELNINKNGISVSGVTIQGWGNTRQRCRATSPSDNKVQRTNLSHHET